MIPSTLFLLIKTSNSIYGKDTIKKMLEQDRGRERLKYSLHHRDQNNILEGQEVGLHAHCVASTPDWHSTALRVLP